MRTARKTGLVAVLVGMALAPLCVLAASVPNFPPDPVGESLYRAQLYHHTLLPLAIIACAVLAACVAHSSQHRTQSPDSPES